MTNKELLNANLLDIVFDNRNKEYGAYALRRGYNKRMLISLSAGLFLILLFILFTSFRQKDENISKQQIDHPHTVVVEIKPPLPDKPEIKKSLPKPALPVAPKIATAQFVNIKIVPNEQVKKPLVEQTEFDSKQIDDKESTGVEETDKVVIKERPDDGTGAGKEPVDETLLSAPSYSAPEYPGGQEALSRFLSQNLATPNNLETGEKKMVRVRFKVDTDGAVTGFEIEQTAGSEYDKEVIRVCKKMRRWKPALQNGTAVPVSYVLPVTFIGMEQ